MENLEKQKLMYCLKWDLNKYTDKSLLRSPLLIMVWKVPLYKILQEAMEQGLRMSG